MLDRRKKSEDKFWFSQNRNQIPTYQKEVLKIKELKANLM